MQPDYIVDQRAALQTEVSGSIIGSVLCAGAQPAGQNKLSTRLPLSVKNTHRSVNYC